MRRHLDGARPAAPRRAKHGRAACASSPASRPDDGRPRPPAPEVEEAVLDRFARERPWAVAPRRGAPRALRWRRGGGARPWWRLLLVPWSCSADESSKRRRQRVCHRAARPPAAASGAAASAYVAARCPPARGCASGRAGCGTTQEIRAVVRPRGLAAGLAGGVAPTTGTAAEAPCVPAVMRPSDYRVRSVVTRQLGARRQAAPTSVQARSSTADRRDSRRQAQVRCSHGSRRRPSRADQSLLSASWVMTTPWRRLGRRRRRDLVRIT